MDRQRGDTLVVALVVILLGFVATAPRDSEPAARAVVAGLPASPCVGLAPEQRQACLRVAWGAAGR